MSIADSTTKLSLSLHKGRGLPDRLGYENGPTFNRKLPTRLELFCRICHSPFYPVTFILSLNFCSTCSSCRTCQWLHALVIWYAVYCIRGVKINRHAVLNLRLLRRSYFNLLLTNLPDMKNRASAQRLGLSLRRYLETSARFPTRNACPSLNPHGHFAGQSYVPIVPLFIFFGAN